MRAVSLATLLDIASLCSKGINPACCPSPTSAPVITSAMSCAVGEYSGYNSAYAALASASVITKSCSVCPKRALNCD